MVQSIYIMIHGFTVTIVKCHEVGLTSLSKLVQDW
jgi:hypothetical protein